MSQKHCDEPENIEEIMKQKILRKPSSPEPPKVQKYLKKKKVKRKVRICMFSVVHMYL